MCYSRCLPKFALQPVLQVQNGRVDVKQEAVVKPKSVVRFPTRFTSVPQHTLQKNVGMLLYPIKAVSGTSSVYPGLGTASAVVPMSLTGALGFSVVWSLCINPRPRYGCELALVVAGVSQCVSLLFTSSVAIVIASPPNTVPTELNVAMRMIANWTHLLAVLVTTYICYRRAQAIWVASPRAAHCVAPVVSLAVVTAAIASRITGTISELNLFRGITSEDPALFSAQQFTRAYVNFTAGVFALFSEAYVTVVIAQFRLGSSTSMPGTSHSMKLMSSKAMLRNRVRLAYAVLICTTFLVQSGLQVATLLRINRFAPFHSMGWSLVIIRLFEFRSEILSPAMSRPAGAGGGPIRTFVSTASSGLTRDPSFTSVRQHSGATEQLGISASVHGGLSGSCTGGVGRVGMNGNAAVGNAHSNMFII